MSREIDALVLVAYAGKIVNDIPEFSKDIEQSLGYIRSNKTELYNGQPITQEDVDNGYASETFLCLGRLMAEQYFGIDSDRTPGFNPYTDIALEVTSELSPLGTDETPAEVPEGLNRYTLFNEEALLGMLETVKTDKQKSDELSRKWQIALDIQKNRDTVAIQAYITEEFIEASGPTMGMDVVAPETVQFDDDLNVIVQTHNLEDLFEHAGVKPRTVEMPYYYTFGIHNGAEMLASLLLDLRELSSRLAQA